MNKTNVHLINLKEQTTFPSTPKEGDVINHTTGAFIFKSGIWSQLNGGAPTPDKYQLKSGSSAISTTTADVVTFNNLTIGTSYRIEVGVQSSTDPGANTAVSIHPQSAGPFGGVAWRQGNGGSNPVLNASSAFCTFVASEATYSISVLILGAGTPGTGTNITLIDPTIVEYNFTTITTDFT